MNANPDETPVARAKRETLEIPDSVRRIIDDRDGGHCRVCGKYLGSERAIHHIVFGGDERGMGGRRVHDPDEMVTVCWLGANSCHDLVHSRKRLWQPYLLAIVHRPGTTAMQLKRWSERKRNG